MKNEIHKLLEKYWKGLLSVSAFLIFWELSVVDGTTNKFFFSKPSLILEEGFRLLQSGFLWPHVLMSLKTLLMGILLAVLVAVLIGFTMGMYKKAYGFFEPYVYILSTIPKVALLPLIIIWVGVGFHSKVLIVFLSALIPILINVLQGMENANKEYLRMAKSLGANDFQIACAVTFFEVLPFLFSGLKISLGRAVSGLVMSEAFGSGSGLGYLISLYGMSFQAGKLMFVIFMLFIMVMIFKNMIGFFESYVLRYGK